jgi:Carbohydrate-binding module 48 (Isoamylase N-terminal domain)
MYERNEDSRMRDSFDNSVERAAAELRRPVRFDHEFDQRVMSEVRALPRHRFGTWARALRPRTVTVNPMLSGLAAAAVLVAALTVGHFTGGGTIVVTPDEFSEATTPSTSTREVGLGGTAGKRDVQFVLIAPTARKVAVVGDFNDWDATHEYFQARHRGGGVWSVTAPVPVGHHRYSFVVDDTVWVADPSAPRVVDHDYGMPGSALVVAEGIR